MFFFHKYNCYSHQRHGTRTDRRENDPHDNKLYQLPFPDDQKEKEIQSHGEADKSSVVISFYSMAE